MSCTAQMNVATVAGRAAVAPSARKAVAAPALSLRSSTFVGKAVASVKMPASNANRLSLTVYAKGKGKNAGRRDGPPGRKGGMPALPKLDPENPNFMIYVRSKKVKQWYPVSVIQGGSQAKVLTQGMETGWAKGIASATLTRNVGSVIYKDEMAVRQSVYQMHPILKSAKEVEYGYKMIDTNDIMMSMQKTDDVELIPPEDEMPAAPADAVKNSFQDTIGSVKKAFGMGGDKEKTA